MTDIQPFNFDGHEVRVIVDDDGTEWFVAKDVAEALGYRMASDMTRRLDPVDKDKRSVRTAWSESQDMSVITESGVYESIFGSRIETARAFKRWLVEEVLPQIRRTGKYAPQAQMPTHAEALRGWADTIDQLAISEAKVAELTPAAEAWERINNAEGVYSVREAAHLLSSVGIDTGERKLFAYMRSIAWTNQSNEPYQSAINLGRLHRETSVWTSPNSGTEYKRNTTRVTAKGVADLLDRLNRKQGQLVLIPGDAA